MNVSDQIIQVLDNLCEKFGLAIDWTSENVLPYITTLCTKLVTWEIWTSVAWMVFAVVASIIWIVILRVYRSAIKNSLSNAGNLGIIACLGSMIIFIGTILTVGLQTFDIIKCVTFPEMFIFEYIQGLINAA